MLHLSHLRCCVHCVHSLCAFTVRTVLVQVLQTSDPRRAASTRRRKKTWRRRAVDASFEKSFLFRVKFSNQYANFVEDLKRSYQENFLVRAGHRLGTPAGRSRWLFKKKFFLFFFKFFLNHEGPGPDLCTNRQLLRRGASLLILDMLGRPDRKICMIDDHAQISLCF